MKVMFISHSSQMAGAERALVNVMSFVDRTKISPICVFPQQDGPAKKKIADLNIPIIELEYGFYIPGYSSNFNKMYNEFFELFNVVRPCSVVVNTQVLFPAVLAAKAINIKVILHSHGLISKELFPLLNDSKWSAIDALHILLSDTVFVPAAFIKDIYNERYHSLAKKIKVIGNGVDINEFSKYENISSCGPADAKKPIFSMLCTIEKNKGVEQFINAAKIYLEKNGDASFYVYGCGSEIYVDELLGLIDVLGISHSFFIKDKTMDVESVYRASTGVIVASKIESFSLVCIEAMSYGCPVIATRCGGPEEIIDDGIDGYLVNIGDANKTADRMHNLVSIPYLRERFSVACKNKVYSKFNIHDISDLYYEEVINTSMNAVSGDESNVLFTRIAFDLLSDKDLIKPVQSLSYEVDDSIAYTNCCDLYNPQENIRFSFSSKCRFNDFPYVGGFYKISDDINIEFIEFYIGGGGKDGISNLNGVFGVELVLENRIITNVAYSVYDVVFNNGIVRVPVQPMRIPALSNLEVRLFTKDVSSPVYVIGYRKFIGFNFFPLIKLGVLNGSS